VRRGKPSVISAGIEEARLTNGPEGEEKNRSCSITIDAKGRRCSNVF